MCAGNYPDPKKDLKPRVLTAEEYVVMGVGSHLIPELRVDPQPREKNNKAVFEFVTPDGEKICVPTGSTVKCLLSNK
jgi:hypothetical protein